MAILFRVNRRHRCNRRTDRRTGCNALCGLRGRAA